MTHCRPVTAPLLLLIALTRSLAATASDDACWLELTYGASQGFLSASTSLRFDDADIGALDELPESARDRKPLLPTTHEVRRVRAEFAAMRNKGSQTLWYDPESSRVLQIHRVSDGSSKSRAKLYRFLTNGVHRERREPLSRGDTDISAWTVTSQQLIDYPADRPPGLKVVNSAMLLAEAAAMARNNEARRTMLAFTDTQLFRVQLEARGIEQFAEKFTLKRNNKTSNIKGERRVMRIGIESQLLGDEDEDDPFTLLELEGDLSVLVDMELFLPVLVEGSWYRIGTIPAALESARMLPAGTAGCAD